MDLGLSGRTALVTGGSKGIGLATGRCLAAEGVDVTLVARSADVLAAAAAGIAGPGKVATLAADLADEAERRRVVEAVGPVDILVNNAGGIPGGNLLEFDDARLKDVWELKVFGYISLCRHYYGLMKAQGHGVIVNVIGNAAEALDFDYIAGSTANAGLCAFTRTLGSVSSRDGIRAVAINPGPVDTDRLKTLMRKKAADRTGSAENWEALKEPLPFGRAASAEEIAAMVAMLASDRSAYTSGTVVTIDGGIANQSRTF
ncbi:short-chain dehydrogenase/reductase [Acuticoccus sp. I52.16.1]|uniref:short-chain dehydrogenase/reductase n=1 Tax=Acuticoccus sp. I52.16.1 TaxID=2928472 RepID=UPI001FD575F7|nr:short-chain dehydrogenase/reductase [Acuticoccus sp. I52.16.1]UOM35553.1 short-chain dehydrogenase/reductase [Acuticoccus sp. I52.16.1]